MIPTRVWVIKQKGVGAWALPPKELGYGHAPPPFLILAFLQYLDIYPPPSNALTPLL